MSTPKAKRFAARTPALDNISQIADTRRDLGVPVQLIPMSDIALDPKNPRKLSLDPNDLERIDPADPNAEIKERELEELRGLAQSIATGGLHNPVQVYRRGDGFVLFVGQRRFLAHRLLGHSAIRASVYHERPAQAAVWQFTENFQRSDISLFERIVSLRDIFTELQLLDARPTVLAEALQEHAGLGRAIAFRYISVLNGPKVVLDAIQDGRLTNLKKAAELSQLDDVEAADALVAFLEGATIESMPAIVLPSAPSVVANPVRRQGRPAQAVTLPKVKNPHTIRMIVAKVLGEDELPDIDWSDYKQAGRAFLDMVRKLEQAQQ